MRLDFRNIGKGLEAIAGAKKARDLAQESARYDVTEGAYGPGLQENIQQLEGLKAQDPAQAAAYDQAIGELTRRQGLTAPDYSVASGAQGYGTRQEARQAAAPLRAEGLAGVYRQYGDVAQADALEARAYEQQRALAREARDVEAFGLAKTKAGQEIETGKLTIAEKQRAAADAKKMDDFSTWRSQNPQADFAAMSAKAQELGMSTDAQFKIASNLTGIKEQEFKASQQRIEDLVKDQPLDGLLKAHKESKDLDPGSHFEVIRGKGNTVSLNRVDTATGKVIQPNVFSGSEAETTAYLYKAAKNPATIIDYTMNLEKNRAAIDKDKASAEKDRALSGRYARDGETEKGLTKKVADVESLLGRKLSEPEKLTLFGLSAKPSNRPEFTPQAYTSTVKNYVDMGLSLPAARAEADILYGRGPAAGNIDAELQKANAAKTTGTAAKPIEVQPGERYITAPGAAVRAPLNQFLRESRRGMFGGVEYFYTDPVTGRRYTTEQYNQLLNQ